MSSGHDEQARLLSALFRGLEAQEPGLETVVDELVEDVRRPSVDALDAPPPRRIAIAMAMAIFSQPHLTVTFARRRGQKLMDHEEVDDAPLVLPNELLERALGLSTWELDDIREEIDRRVGRVLKQARSLHWLWTRFGLPDSSPEPLFRVLFPGAPHRLGPVGLVRRGPQLYAVVDQNPEPPLQSLYMPWLDLDPERVFPPCSTFGARYVDKGLTHSMGRGIGASEDECRELLDGMVTIVPRDTCSRFLAHDHWRSRASGAMTRLAHPYGDGAWLTRVLDPDEVDWVSFLSLDDGVIRLGNAKAAFDGLALARVRTMVRHLYAEVLARLGTQEHEGAAIPDDLDLYDVGSHMEAVLRPLLAWPKSIKTANEIASQLGVDVTTAQAALQRVDEIWSAQATNSWAAPPREERAHSVQTVITTHLAVMQASAREVYHREQDHRWNHRNVLTLFLAHYMAEAPLQRLWMKGLSDVVPDADGPLPATEDVLRDWFWGTWQRVLDTIDTDAVEAMPTYDGVGRT